MTELVRRVPPLLRAEPALAALAGASHGVLAVPEPARAITVAGLAHLSARVPIVVAVPAQADADRLTHDLTAFLGPEQVEAFPAWETLPFERVSPAVETMGRRLRTIWRLRHGPAPRVVVASVKALLQRLGPGAGEQAPVEVRAGQTYDEAELIAHLVAIGYRREYQVEHRGEVAVRGGIIDVFPSTADLPVRIDLWGDEVDRLTDFDVFSQRSLEDRDEVEIFGCREVLADDAVRSRAAVLLEAEPWAREQWDRLAEGLVFDGMESWLPWLVEDELLLTDLLPDSAQLILVEPRRMRDRASEVLDEEAALAATLAQTWAARDTEFPSLHLPFDRLLARTSVPAWSLTNTAEGPDTPAVDANGWDPVVGDASRLLSRLGSLARSGFRIVVCADGPGSAERVGAALREAGLIVRARMDPTAELAATEPEPGITLVVAPLERGFVLNAAKVAVLAESDVTGRRRAHRRPRVRQRSIDSGFFDDLKPGDYVVHHQHGVARYAGMVTRSIGGAERDYLLLEYRGGDKLYVPSDQIDAVTPYTGGETPSLSRMGGADWERTRRRVRAAVRESAQELVVL